MAMSDWPQLCGLAVVICGSQSAFRREARLLQRLNKKWGPEETATMLKGAKQLGWTSLKGLAGIDGVGRRMAVTACYDAEKRSPVSLHDFEGIL
jgi:hypothetical protein